MTMDIADGGQLVVPDQSQAGALDLQGGRLNATNAWELCSAALWRRLSDTSGDADDAVRSIARDDRLLDEAKQVAPLLAERAARATATEVMHELIKLSPLYGIRKLSDGEYAELFAAYLEVLTTIPIEAVRHGIREYNKIGEFFPKPAQIYTPAVVHASLLWKAAYRVKRAADWRDRNPPPPSAEEREADRRRLIEAGIMTEDGKLSPMIFRKPPDSTAPRETPQQAADRLRRVADGAGMPDDPEPEIEEAI